MSKLHREMNEAARLARGAFRFAASAMFAAALGATAAQAATWTNGNWSVAANWAEGVVPADGEAVTINNPTAGATFNVDVGSVKISSLTFASGGKQCYVVGGTLNISAQAAVVANHSMTISNSLVLSHSAPMLRAATTSGRSYYCGDVTLTHATGDLYSQGKGGSTFYGTVTVPRDFRPGGGAAWQSGSHHYFYGPLKCRHVLNASLYDDTTYHYESTSNSWTYFETGFYVRNVVATAGALPRTAVLRAFGSDSYSGGTCSLGGTDQTIDRLSGTTKQLTVNGGSSAMTLTLLATASDTSKAVLNGSLSLVYAPTNSNYVQTVNGGACSMNGSLTVSNGTFRVGGTSSFANVKRIVVADGARFELLTETANALAGVTNIVLGANSHFAITNATTPFADNAVSLEMTATSSFDLPDGADYLFAAAKVDGTPLDGGTYTGDGTVPQFKGSGSITIPDIEMPTVSATWDGGGADEGIGTDANWDGDATPALNAKSLYPLFAAGGDRALVDRALDFKGLHFGGSSASFSLVSNSPSASLTLRQSGIAVDASHAATVDAPVTIKSDQSWSLARGATLRFKTPVGMSSPYAVTVVGSDETSGSAATERPTSTLRLDAPNGFGGSFAVSGAQVLVYSATNAFGPSSDAAVTLADSRLALYGSTIERPISIGGTNDKYYWFASYAGGDGTNRMTKALTVSNCTYWRPRVENVLVTEDGVTVPCDVITAGGGTWIVRGKPWVHFNTSSSVSALELTGGEKMRFQVAGNVIRRLKMISSCQVHCEVDNPFSGTTTLFCGSSGSSLDLHGHEVSVSEFGSTSGGTVKSETQGMLVLNAQSGTITNGAVRFTGAAGFKMGGPGAVWFKTAMESTGSVSVTRGTLGFTQTGSWENCADVTVGGTGRLVVAKDKTFAKNAVFFFADSGVLQIPDGVTLRVGQMFVDGVPVRNGMYGSATSPASNKSQAAHFAGNGVLLVGKLGTIFLLR